MTGAELITQVKQLLVNRTSATLDTTWYLARVNAGYRRLATWAERRPDGSTIRQVRFPQLYDVINRTIASGLGSNFIANSTGVYSVISLWDATNTRRIVRKPLRRLQTIDPTDTGYIRIWAPGGDGGVAGYFIWALPETNTSVDQYVYTYPETLANDATAPVIDEAWHEAIELLAAADAARQLAIPEAKAEFMQEARDFIGSQVLPSEVHGSGGPHWFTVGTTHARST
jgi:hypothetical protein